MGARKRHSKRSNSKQAAISFLTNITLGSEKELKSVKKLPPSIKETVSSHSLNSIYKHANYGSMSVTSHTFTDEYAMDKPSSSYVNDVHSKVTASNSSFSRSRANSRYDHDVEGQLYNRSLSLDNSSQRHRSLSSDSNTSSTEFVEHHKLTREDSQKPIASERIRKKSDSQQDTIDIEKVSLESSTGFMSVFRYYKGIIRSSTQTTEQKHSHHQSQPFIRSYFHQHLLNIHLHRRKAISYGHFISQSSNRQTSEDEDDSNPFGIKRTGSFLSVTAYNPNYLEDNTILEESIQSHSNEKTIQTTKLNHLNKSTRALVNEMFRESHPEINLSLTKIKAIKQHMLSIGNSVNLEVSTVSHAYVYFEKLLQKQIVTKQNRKLIAGCCLFLATKVNEPKGLNYQQLLDSIYSELYVNSKDIKNHEFAVFADLEFNLYVPVYEFMPHIDRILLESDIQSIDDYLGHNSFYKFDVS